MIDLHEHRSWLIILALAALLIIGNGTLLNLAQNKASRKLTDLRHEKARVAETTAQLQRDIADAVSMNGKIDEKTANRLFTRIDRLRSGQDFEDTAAQYGLSEFVYTLYPEEIIRIQTAGSTPHELANTRWTVAAKALTDLDVFAFLETLSRILPGSFALSRVSIERISNIDSALTSANVRFSAEGEWLSNGATPATGSNSP